MPCRVCARQQKIQPATKVAPTETALTEHSMGSFLDKILKYLVGRKIAKATYSHDGGLLVEFTDGVALSIEPPVNALLVKSGQSFYDFSLVDSVGDEGKLTSQEVKNILHHTAEKRNF